MQKINRRDFLKLSAALPAAAVLAKMAPSLLRSDLGQIKPLPNIIVIVIDTMSGQNLSIYNYPRRTTRNFERYAKRAIVYHAHQSGGNFTVPGTASLLTGMYPWTHRAINRGGFVARELTERNIFRLVSKPYRKLVFTQNLWAAHLLGQFRGDIDQFLSPALFTESAQVIGDKFPKDLNAAYLSLDEFLFWQDNPPPSLIFGIPERALLAYKDIHARDNSPDYPAGLPGTALLPINFRLDKVFDGILATIDRLRSEASSPYLAYFHLWGVHEPYRPQEKFAGLFNDSWIPEPKPRHLLGGKHAEEVLLKKRRHYDQYIANVDFEFGRLMDSLEQNQILDNSFVVVTADHGESLERGTWGHSNPLLFEPLVHVPLLILTPGQQERVDIYSPTNSVDILATLAYITGQTIPSWCEGERLPGIGEEPTSIGSSLRNSFSVESKSNPAHSPIDRVTVAMRQGNTKLIYYKNRDEYEFYELYNLEDDPEEMINLYEDSPNIAKPLREELLLRLSLANQPYQDK